MIQYQKGAFNLNLLTRFHGSAVYRAMLPGLSSAALYCLIEYRFNEKRFLDPTAVALLVGSATFLIIFRVGIAYDRYWEACSSVFAMMSRWMDSAVHTACYHMQSHHYDDIKPPSYFDHPELDFLFLTRDRERHTVNRTSSRRRVRAVTRSINYIENRAKQIQSAHMSRDPSVSSGIGEPSPLKGPPMLDGGWGLLFRNKKGPPTSTYLNPSHLNSGPDQKGFASTQGGRTPALFLQELVHLASLLNAVALATLRNDVDGAESPLDVYMLGAPWPTVDSSELSNEPLRDALRYFTGADRTPKGRTNYNAQRPLPVLGGISNAEIRFLQMAKGPMAKTQLAWSWLSEFIVREHLAGSQGEVGSPMISRTMQFLSNGMEQYGQARKIMFIPFPFPHAQLSAFLIWATVPTIPLLLAQYVVEIWIGAVLTFLTVTCLVGLHEVARELENPFRNVPNDVPVCTLQAQFNEALITIYSGYHPDAYWDPAQPDGGTWPESPGGRDKSYYENGVPSTIYEEDVDNSKLAALNEVIEEQGEALAATRAEIERLKKLLRETEQDDGIAHFCQYTRN